MKTKDLKVTAEQARKLYESNPELREVLKNTFTGAELGINDFPKSWEDLDFEEINKKIRYAPYIGSHSKIGSSQVNGSSLHKNSLPSRADAEKILAECQLRMIAFQCNGYETEEEWIDWEDLSNDKYNVYYDADSKEMKIAHNLIYNRGLIYFKKQEHIERSLTEHKDLWKKYFKIK